MLIKKWILLLLIFALGATFGAFLPLKKERSDSVFATYQGGELRNEDLRGISGSQIIDSEKSLYYLKKRYVDQKLKEEFLGPEGSYLNFEEVLVDSDEFHNFLKTSGYDINKVSQKEYQNFYDNFRIKKANEVQNKRFLEKANELQLRYQFALPTYPEVKLKSSGTAGLGSDSASLKISMFISYLHPQLKNSIASMNQLNEAFPNQIQFEIRFLGNDLEDSVSFLAFESLLCANSQDRLSAFHSGLIDTIPQTAEDLEKIAVQANVKMDKFRDCLKTRQFREVVLKDQKELSDFSGVTEPVFVIKRKIVPSVEDFQILKDLVQREL